MKKILFLSLFILACFAMEAQLPSSNIYLFDLQLDYEKDSLYLSNPQYITHFNRSGYNNHPHFLSDEELIISSRSSFENQPELYILNTATLSRVKVTATSVGEYSPQRMPDYFNFSAVRMEFLPQDTLLRLWQFPLDRSNNGRPVFNNITNIGYYAWLNSRDLILYRVQVPSLLVKTDIYSDYPQIEEEQIIARNVGRCFVPTYGGTFLYVQKYDDGSADIMRYDTRAFSSDQQSIKVTAAYPGAEDFALLSDGTILMAYESQIFKFKEGTGQGWTPLIDLRAYNINGITRLALSPNNGKLAIVAR